MAGISASWYKETDEKNNYTKLYRLLVDGGTQAVRCVFDGIHTPSLLKAAFIANKAILQKLKKPKGKVLNNEQWDKLYPPSGISPKSEDFDITLLFVLLRNICGLTAPATGWDVLPPTTDNSIEADLARIKYYRNNTIAHKPNTDINDADFEQHWQDISSALLSLGLGQEDIDDLKFAPLGEKDYNQLLYDWFISDEDIKTQLQEVKAGTADIKSDTGDLKSDTADLKSDTADLKSDTADLKSDAADLKSDTADLKSDAADLKSDTADLKSDTADLKSDTGDLKSDTADLKSDTADLKSDTADLKSDTGDLKSDTADLKSDTADLKSDTAYLKSDTADLKSDTADLKSDTADLKSDTADLKSDTVDIKSETALIPGIREDISHMKSIYSSTQPKVLLINQLTKCDFSSLIKSLCKSFHPNTRQWVLDEVKTLVYGGESQPCEMMVITAGPGMGKSTIAAKICQTYQELGCLAGCHFFQFSNSTRNDPRLMLQSIARQMCDTVPGYGEALEGKLHTNLGKDIIDMDCEGLFTVLLEEPCQKLKFKESFVFVLDAIDECCSNLKHELQDILKNKLSFLPSWLRFVITTRPPPSFNAVEAKKSIFIDPRDPKNELDIEIFFRANLKNIDEESEVMEQLVKVSVGLFLVAFFLIDEIQKEKIFSSSELMVIFPRGLSSVYEKYFERLRTVLLPYITEEEGFFRMLEAVVASKNPIPIEMMYSILGLKSVSEIPRGERKARSDALSQLHSLFPVENDHVGAFHKTVVDFLILEEKEQDFNISVGKMSKNGVEKLPDEAACIHGASIKVPDSRSHEKGESFATRNEKRDQNKPLNTSCTEEPPKKHDFEFSTDDGNKVLVNQCYEVLSDIMNEKKDLNKALHLTDSEIYALRFVWDLLKSSSNYSEFFNYFLISALLYCRQYHDHTIESETIRTRVDNAFHRVFSICARFFVVFHDGHKKWCPFVQPLKFGRYAEFVLQTANRLRIGQEITTTSVLEPLQKHKLSHCEIKFIDIQQAPQDVNLTNSSISILGCEEGFFFVQQKDQNTIVMKYRRDGALDFQKSFPGKKEVHKSPNHRFIVVIGEELEKSDIEIRSATTLESVKSFQSPNVIRSCHVFGYQPWYIAVRCYNNKIYVMEGETGTIVSTIAGIGQYVEVEGVGYLGHILLGTSNRYRNDLFTDEDGNFLEEMSWLPQGYIIGEARKSKVYLRKLFLCHYEKPEERIPIYPTKAFDWCCTWSSWRSSFGYGESVGFSSDGSLLAFHYEGSIFIRYTENCSLYKQVYLGPTNFAIFDHRGILLLTKDYVVVYDGSRVNDGVVMIINLHTNEIEHIYLCTSDLHLFSKITNEPFTLIINLASGNKCQVQLCALHNFDL